MASAGQLEIEGQHGEMVSLVSRYLPNAMVITIITLNDTQEGQMILHDPALDKNIVAERLRVCAHCSEANA